MRSARGAVGEGGRGGHCTFLDRLGLEGVFSKGGLSLVQVVSGGGRWCEREVWWGGGGAGLVGGGAVVRGQER